MTPKRQPVMPPTTPPTMPPTLIGDEGGASMTVSTLYVTDSTVTLKKSEAAEGDESTVSSEAEIESLTDSETPVTEDVTTAEPHESSTVTQPLTPVSETRTAEMPSRKEASAITSADQAASRVQAVARGRKARLHAEDVAAAKAAKADAKAAAAATEVAARRVQAYARGRMVRAAAAKAKVEEETKVIDMYPIEPAPIPDVGLGAFDTNQYFWYCEKTVKVGGEAGAGPDHPEPPKMNEDKQTFAQFEVEEVDASEVEGKAKMGFAKMQIPSEAKTAHLLADADFVVKEEEQVVTLRNIEDKMKVEYNKDDHKTVSLKNNLNKLEVQQEKEDAVDVIAVADANADVDADANAGADADAGADAVDRLAGFAAAAPEEQFFEAGKQHILFT